MTLSSSPTNYDLIISVQSTDLSLRDTTATYTLTLTPGYQDSDGIPAIITYDFDVTFECKVTTLDFSSTIADQIYAIPQGLL